MKSRASSHKSAEEFIQEKEEGFRKERRNNKSIAMKSISRKGRHHWLRVKWTFMKQSNMIDKVFIIERLKRLKSEGKPLHRKRIGEIEYRIGYYRVGENGRARGKWVWGQFCPMIPRRDLVRLIRKARKERTIS